MKTVTLACCHWAVAALLVANSIADASTSLPPSIGFLTLESSPAQVGPEGQAAYQLASKLTRAEWILADDDGSLVDVAGQPFAASRFQAIWYHQGDSTGRVVRAGSIQALKQFVGAGKGLLLSGAALSLVHGLGVESTQPRLMANRAPSGPMSFHTLEASHPIFRGLNLVGFPWDDSVGGFPREFDVPIAESGLSVYADFVGSGGPRQGKVLGWVDESGANPLVEYSLGQGRIMAMGWRLASYANDTAATRTNLHGLTGNLLSYLSQQQSWKEVAPRPPVPGPGMPEDQRLALERALRDLSNTFGDRYPQGGAFLSRLQSLKAAQERILKNQEGSASDLAGQLQQIAGQFQALRTEALLANPLLDFDRLLLVQRGVNQMGLPANYCANTEIPMTGYDNQLVVLSPVRPDGKLTPLYRPAGGRFVGDVDLHFQGDRLLFSMPGANGRWQIFEMKADGSNLQELPLITEPDVDNYDACYLPDGRLVFTATAPFVGVPCVNGSSHVANLYLRHQDGSIRQLTVDQEHNWCPTVDNSGRVMYLRWEYTDLPHSNSRILFTMNPDGTAQKAIYGSSSFFPPSFFFARPVPGHPTKIVGIATGHHGVARAGRLLILDPAQGSREADGVVQEIPGWGKKVEPIIRDTLADGVWPQFLHPYALSEKYFLAAAKPASDSPWGLYLVDVFDNALLLKALPGYALLEPLPLRATARPPVIADKVDGTRPDAQVYLSDIYAGGGLQGIPRGTVKNLRLITYHYAYRGMGGLLGSIGMNGPWDVKQVLGTVPVEPDGSALFRVPANTPIAVQPLDQNGQSLQGMRSWFTAMPGEVLSCVGCHEPAPTTPTTLGTLAARRSPSVIQPWHGPTRGFAFSREVQPVLDRYCVGCHDGQSRFDGRILGDLRGDQLIQNWWSGFAGNVGAPVGGRFSVAYAELHRFVRRPGIESDIHLPAPMEFHAETTELVQLLRKGHHNVQLDPESWDRLFTWIDLNAPYHGTWKEIVGEKPVQPMAERRREMSRRYANVDLDPEAIPNQKPALAEPIVPASAPKMKVATPLLAEWPFGAAEARRRQAQAGATTTQRLTLPNGTLLDLALIPAGEFIMGDANGCPDEQPLTRIKIVQPFWMSRTEISNEQFAGFDPQHDSHFEPMHAYQFGIHGFPVNKPRQPVVRVSWLQARSFCQWLSAQTGHRVDLPTEAQWEYACRAGADTSMWYGGLDDDFAAYANLGDVNLRGYLLETYIHVRPMANYSRFDDWVPKDERFDDGGFVSVEVGRYRPNPWGLRDMHGNVWEWTKSTLRPYPYRDDDGRNEVSAPDPKVVRGGSWYDRPQRCRSGFRLAYQPYQRVFNVGFRVVMEASAPPPKKLTLESASLNGN